MTPDDNEIRLHAEIIFSHNDGLFSPIDVCPPFLPAVKLPARRHGASGKARRISGQQIYQRATRGPESRAHAERKNSPERPPGPARRGKEAIKVLL
jgi:hypothetical protein